MEAEHASSPAHPPLCQASLCVGDSEGQAWVRAFQEGLEKLGWAEGRSIRVEVRWSVPGDVEALPRPAVELVASQPDLILSQGTPSTAALLQQTRTIPIKFAIRSNAQQRCKVWHRCC